MSIESSAVAVLVIRKLSLRSRNLEMNLLTLGVQGGKGPVGHAPPPTLYDLGGGGCPATLQVFTAKTQNFKLKLKF